MKTILVCMMTAFSLIALYCFVRGIPLQKWRDKAITRRARGENVDDELSIIRSEGFTLTLMFFTCIGAVGALYHLLITYCQ